MDVETSELIASDAYYLFQFNLSNCDIVFKLIQALKTKEKWGCFAQFYLNLNYSFLCNKYNEELKIFLVSSFQLKKFNLKIASSTWWLRYLTYYKAEIIDTSFFFTWIVGWVDSIDNSSSYPVVIMGSGGSNLTFSLFYNLLDII